MPSGCASRQSMLSIEAGENPFGFAGRSGSKRSTRSIRRRQCRFVPPEECWSRNRLKFCNRGSTGSSSIQPGDTFSGMRRHFLSRG